MDVYLGENSLCSSKVLRVFQFESQSFKIDNLPPEVKKNSI
jgi:hypothetical protein